MSGELGQVLTSATALGAAAVGGGLGIFSVMVLPALDPLPAGQAVAAMQRMNEVAVRPPFLSVFLGTAIGSAGVVVLTVLEGTEPGSARRLAGAGLYAVTVALTGARNVPANDLLATVDPSDPAAATEGWAAFRHRWTRANHLRSLTALGAATLLTWP